MKSLQRCLSARRTNTHGIVAQTLRHDIIMRLCVKPTSGSAQNIRTIYLPDVVSTCLALYAYVLYSLEARHPSHCQICCFNVKTDIIHLQQPGPGYTVISRLCRSIASKFNKRMWHDTSRIQSALLHANRNSSLCTGISLFSPFRLGKITSASTLVPSPLSAHLNISLSLSVSLSQAHHRLSEHAQYAQSLAISFSKSGRYTGGYVSLSPGARHAQHMLNRMLIYVYTCRQIYTV